MERYEIVVDDEGNYCGLIPSENGPLVQYADAQATIAALQDVIKQMGGQAAVLAKDAMAAKEQVAALQARVQELEAIKIPDDAFTYCAYCGEKSPVDEHNEDLAAHIKVCPKHPMRDVESQLTQRTAELEAAKHNADVYQKMHAVASMYGNILSGENADLQAELECVRGQYADLRKMVLVLPKVEGEITANRVCTIMMHGMYCEEFTKLLQLRQGIEG